MEKVTTDRKVIPGIPLSEKELKEYQKSFSDMEESIAYCCKHKSKKK